MWSKFVHSERWEKPLNQSLALVDNILVMVRVNSTLEKCLYFLYFFSIVIIFDDFLKYFRARKKHSLKESRWPLTISLWHFQSPKPKLPCPSIWPSTLALEYRYYYWCKITVNFLTSMSAETGAAPPPTPPPPPPLLPPGLEPVGPVVVLVLWPTGLSRTLDFFWTTKSSA